MASFPRSVGTPGKACARRVRLDNRTSLWERRGALQTIHFPPFRLDLAAGQLWRGDRRVPLRPKTFAVLEHLASRPGELVAKEDLLDAVWGDVAVTEDVARISVRELRRALDDDPERPRFLETVHGRGYRFVADIREPLDEAARPEATETPAPGLIGREAELATLRGWLDAARRGERVVGLVGGDAGIGKTTLIDAFLAHHLATEARVARGECRELIGAAEPYLPLLEALGHHAGGPGRERLRASLETHAPMWLAQMPALVDAGEAERLRQRFFGATGERMVRELAEWAETTSEDELLVLVLEDLHWCDHATLDAVRALAHRRGRARLLLLGTYRPIDAIVAEHPLVAVRADLLRRKRGHELMLSGLSRTAIGGYLTARAGPPPPALLDFVHDRSEGNPFFMVALLDHLLARGVVAVTPEGWRLEDAPALAGAGMPDDLREMLQRQIDGVPAATREMLAVASVVGAEFAAQAVAAGLANDAVEDVEDACDALVRQGRILRASAEGEWPDGSAAARYAFRHALYRDVLYDRIPMGRRRRLHQAIGERMERGFGAAAGQVAGELAVHFEHSRDVNRAVEYLRQVAETAQRRFADREALVTIDRALALLRSAGESPERVQHELLLRFMQGSLLFVTKGARDRDVTASCERVRELCRDLGDVPAHLFALLSLFFFEIMRGRLDAACELGDRALDLSGRVAPMLAAVGHVAAGLPRCYRGELAEGARHLEAVPPAEILLGLPLSFDPLLAAHGNLAESALVQLGRIEEAIARGVAVQARGAELGHPFGRAFADHIVSRQHVLFRQPRAALEYAERAGAICEEYALEAEVRVRSRLVRGWARAMVGEARRATAELRPLLGAFGERVGVPLATSYHLMVVEVAFGEGRLAEAQELLHAAGVLVEETGERIEEAELHRWRARVALALQRGDGRAAAEAHLRAALETARRQAARWFELRAAVDLGALWLDDGRPADARMVVGEALAAFPDTLDLPDLAAARRLLARAA